MLDKVFKLKVYSDNKKTAAKILQTHDGYERFYIHEGDPICSLADLTEKVEALDPAKYLYHANQEKNDFAMWVRVVLGDAKLADQLQKAKNQKQAAEFCKKRFAELTAFVKK